MPSPTRSLTLEAAGAHILERWLVPEDPERFGLETEWLTFPRVCRGSRPDVPALRRVVEPATPLPRGSTITFEPGGQLEISTPPMHTVGEACCAAAEDLAAVRAAGASSGLDLVGLALDPTRPPIRLTPEPRYAALEAFLSRWGPAGTQMMGATAALHVNISAGRSREAALRRWRLANQIGPALVAAFANSPIESGAPTGWRCTRMRVWLQLDNSRCSPPPQWPDPASAYVNWVLDALVMAMRTEGPEWVVPDPPISFGRWITDGYEGVHPTLDDLDYHWTTLFPPVRARGWLELRMIDMLPSPWWRAAAAVTVALLTVASEEAEAVAPAVEGRWREAARHGPRHPAVRHTITRLFKAALDALDDSGADSLSADAAREYHDRYVRRGRCPADDRLDDLQRGILLPEDEMPLTA